MQAEADAGRANAGGSALGQLAVIGVRSRNAALGRFKSPRVWEFV